MRQKCDPDNIATPWLRWLGEDGLYPTTPSLRVGRRGFSTTSSLRDSEAETRMRESGDSAVVCKEGDSLGATEWRCCVQPPPMERSLRSD